MPRLQLSIAVPCSSFISPHFGVWRSLVAHLVRDEGVAGSNPATPTSIKLVAAHLLNAQGVYAFSQSLPYSLQTTLCRLYPYPSLETLSCDVVNSSPNETVAICICAIKKKRCAFSTALRRCRNNDTATDQPQNHKRLLLFYTCPDLSCSSLANIVGSNAQADQWRFWMLNFHTDIEFEYGVVDRLSPRIRRVIANNPSPFTFTGTGTYIIGNGNVAVIDPARCWTSMLRRFWTRWNPMSASVIFGHAYPS